MTDRIEIDALIVYAKDAAIAAAPFCHREDLAVAEQAATAMTTNADIDAAYTVFLRISDRSPLSANVPFWAAATIMWGLMLTRYAARWDLTIPAYAMTAADMARRVAHDAETLADELRQWHTHCTPAQRTADDLNKLWRVVKPLHKAVERYDRRNTIRFMG